MRMEQEDRDLLVRIDENVAALLEARTDHEGRLRRLERFKQWITGILAVIGSGLGIHQTVN